ncbi:D-alanyl-D-alanine carboxypeptidase/D-alanyl-D-alanine endopeptidase [Undibacterium sp. Ji67W]|uniref:D-alanyl-D-alanine carboxypeptidase/D-alanyl-D-alanine endopeptidase n=1 Tax=Undibacterium sp. Ji67W TaxID=3413042 RepID=UPI003BF32D20
MLSLRFRQLILTACTSSLCSAFVPSDAIAQTVLPVTLATSLQKAGVPASAISVMVLPVNASNADATVLAQNADLPMHPASTMKLLTTLVALEELGPNFRWKTQILSDAPAATEVFNGNLYIRGGGDPDLSMQKLQEMLRDLRNRGIRSINGNIVLDRSYFQPERSDINMPPFDEHPDAYYNVVPDALLIHSNISSITVESGNDNVETRLLTPLDNTLIINQLRLNKKPCATWEQTWQAPDVSVSDNAAISITLNSSFPRHCKITQHLNILDRNQYIAHLIRGLWRELGGSWDGKLVDGRVPTSANLLIEHQSETLADTIRIVNKHSDNAMARSIYLSLGTESNPLLNTNSAQAADARIRAWLFRHGINDTGIVLENGSGLSRTEQISARQMAALLLDGARSNWYPEFASSLPVAGMDGTMRKRLKDSPAAQNARIKTGTLKDSVAIAGYVRDVNGQNWVVVAMINTDAAGKARTALDTLINWVASGRDDAANLFEPQLIQ